MNAGAKCLWFLAMCNDSKVNVSALCPRYIIINLLFFGAIFWRRLPNGDVKCSHFRFWQQRQAAALNLSFFAFTCTWRPFVPSKRKRYTSPICYDVTIMNNCIQSSIWKWRSRCSETPYLDFNLWDFLVIQQRFPYWVLLLGNILSAMPLENRVNFTGIVCKPSLLFVFPCNLHSFISPLERPLCSVLLVPLLLPLIYT